MIENLSLGRMAAEAHTVFRMAADAFGVPVPDEASSGDGWRAVAEQYAGLQGEAVLAELARQSVGIYLLGAGLPADFSLADPAYTRVWQAVSVHLYGMLMSDPDEHEAVIEETAQWIEAQNQRGATDE